jgi:hypothetical protein
MKKKKSMHGAFEDKNNPVSMEQMVKWIKEDRRKPDRKRGFG